MGIRFVGRYRPLGRIKIAHFSTYSPPANPQPPVWDTPTGLIGAYNEGTAMDFALIAEDPNGDIDHYVLQSGALPDGISVNQFTGHLLGTIGQVGQDTTYTFTVRVVDKTGLYADQQFNILVKNTGSTVNWVTPSGSVGGGDSGADYMSQVQANSNG